MIDPGVPDDVRAFLAQYIDSVEQMEILLLLHGTPEREWSAAAAAGHLYGQPSSVGRRLAILRLQGLLACRESADDDMYRYAPATPALDLTVGRLADAYRDRRVSVVGLIASRPMDNVRAFADAFRFRKPGD